MSSLPDDPVEGNLPAWEPAPAPAPVERNSADASSQTESGLQSSPIQSSDAPAGLIAVAAVEHAEKDPAWDGWDILRLIILTLVALFVGIFAVLLLARWRFYPHTPLAEVARIPLVAVAGQSIAYIFVLAYMYVLVTRERGRPDFLKAIHWNWPSNIGVYVLAGVALSVGLQLLAHLLPFPKDLPIDNFFRTPAEAWALGILSITLAPLMEELFFRGFLYPVLRRHLGVPVAIFVTALGFALLHGGQLMFSWGPVLVIFLVGLVLTMVRAQKDSVAAGMIIHMAYNGFITAAMFAATDGFRHLEKLNQ